MNLSLRNLMKRLESTRQLRARVEQEARKKGMSEKRIHEATRLATILQLDEAVAQLSVMNKETRVSRRVLSKYKGLRERVIEVGDMEAVPTEQKRKLVLVASNYLTNRPISVQDAKEFVQILKQWEQK